MGAQTYRVAATRVVAPDGQVHKVEVVHFSFCYATLADGETVETQYYEGRDDERAVRAMQLGLAASVAGHLRAGVAWQDAMGS